MVRGETSTDLCELFRSWIVHRQMSVGLLEREHFGRRMVRALFAEIQICRRTDPRGKPNSTFLIHHRVMVAGLAVPDRLLSPIWGGAHRRILRGRRLRIAYRVFYFRRGVPFRVQDWDEIRALLGGPVEYAVGVDGGLAPVSRNLI